MAEIQGLEDLTFESSTTYTILEEIGRGGMGIVYLAERCCMEVSDLVVLKTIRNVSKPLEERLRREAAISTTLRHDNCVRTLGLDAIPYSVLPEDLIRELDQLSGDPQPARPRRSRNRRIRRKMAAARRKRVISSARPKKEEKGDDRKLLLLVMDYVEGTDLRGLARDHLDAGYLLPVPIAAYVVGQVCRALAYAHKHIIHRDISPDNVLINQHGVCKLSDFGVASTETDAVQKLAGKAIYMAPECFTTRSYDERSDIFSLGVVFYYLLTGIRPFWTDTKQPFTAQLEQVRRQVEAGIPAAGELRRDVPEVVSRIVARMLAPDPARRYSRAGPIADELEQEYLYANGFGPTNHSLAAYVRFFESGFQETDTDDVCQLSFLRDERGRLRIQRRLDPADYAPAALAHFRGRPGIVVPAQPAPAARTAAAAQPILRVLAGEGLVESFLVGGEPIEAGSDPANRCVLAELRSRHARISLDGKGAILERVDPVADVRVNGQPVERATLSEGDKLRLGSYQAYFVSEKPLDEARTVLSIDSGGELPDAAGLSARSVAIRFPGSPEVAARVGRFLHEVYGELELTDVLREDFQRGLERMLHFLSDPSPRPMEVRTFPVRSRIVLAVRALDDSTAIADLFRLLKRAAAGRDSNSPMRPPVRGIDRIEFRPHEGSLRLGTGIE